MSDPNFAQIVQMIYKSYTYVQTGKCWLGRDWMATCSSSAVLFGYAVLCEQQVFSGDCALESSLQYDFDVLSLHVFSVP